MLLERTFTISLPAAAHPCRFSSGEEVSTVQKKFYMNESISLARLAAAASYGRARKSVKKSWNLFHLWGNRSFWDSGDDYDDGVDDASDALSAREREGEIIFMCKFFPGESGVFNEKKFAIVIRPHTARA